MATPCPRCGTTKTESVRHGFIYHRLWGMGYHLRRCSFCNRTRLLKRGERSSCRPDNMTAEELTQEFNRKIEEAKAKAQFASHRTGDKMGSKASGGPPGVTNQPSESTVGPADSAAETRETGLCPKCGSTVFRRSRRRWYEKIMKRPRMARCLKCGRRFPYPRLDD
jgi:hypothetical protein